MNIIIAINEKYIEPAKTMLYSLACQQKEYLTVYLLQSSISKTKLDDFQEFVSRKCHGELVIVPIERERFAGVPTLKWWSEETYYRLIAFEILPKRVERALWLDADMVVKGNITELYTQSFDGKYAVVCAEDTKKNHQRLGLSEEHRYFNAGVVLFDFHAIRRDFTVEDVFQCIETHREHLDALDQDVLNLLFENKAKYIDASIYDNETFGFNVLNKEKMTELRDTAKIIHFTGSMKPWNYKGANWADAYWWEYERGRGGRRAAFIKYRLLNSPVKLWHCAREVYYFVLGQINKRRR
ncbi:glycosyltransferase family 8 protein [Dysosmobacter sp. Sow4_B12]|uniref:glycosyltransferase family 8 protein n=1 Tax=Dysosmobacter sp. Sow4_B12 TaxID=3438777 RepID=UPI003F92CC58